MIDIGVAGHAMARHFALEGAQVVLLGKSTDILSGASRGNNVILRIGFDAPPNSIELACIQEGYREYRNIHARLSLPLLKTGALMVAWGDKDLARLSAIIEQAHDSGVGSVRQIGCNEVLAPEPQLAGSVFDAVRIPSGHLIDPWSTSLAYPQWTQAHGAETCFNAKMLDGTFDSGERLLRTRRDDLRARQVINCAGLFGDQLGQRLLGVTGFAVYSRKGQFVTFSKAIVALLRHILLSVPNERTKGVVLTRIVFSNLLADPTAEEQDSRGQARVDSDTLQRLIDTTIERLPGLHDIPVTVIYAGLRPANEKKEYRTRRVDGCNQISVGDIRSTDLTAAPGIARRVYHLYQGGCFRGVVREPLWPQVPNLVEHLPCDRQRPGYDGIICHCEMATHRGVFAALKGPLPTGGFGGLKRRTRACMGRCQGSYYNARVAELNAGRLAQLFATRSCHEHH